MKRLAAILLASAVVVAAGAAIGLGALTQAKADTFHVDYERGRDEADGKTPGTAWKHAPGDPQAQATPARTRLSAGDVVQFAANVRYRGAIVVTASGGHDQPIVFTSAAPGGAIIDGSDPVSFRACRSAADCGGAEAWARLVRLETGPEPATGVAFFTNVGPLRPAQDPNPKDAFYRNEIDVMVEVDGGAMSQGRVRLPGAARAAGGSVALWVKPNIVVYRPILRLDGDVAVFDPKGLQFYTDRPARAALMGAVALIDQPGEFAPLPGGGAVAMLPEGARSVSVAAGRGGLSLRRASNVAVRNLTFENMTDAGGLAPAGVSIFADQGQGLTIEGNRFLRQVMPRGQGPIVTRRVSDIRIVRNRIEGIELGSGMRLSGPADRILVEENDIRHIGRTGVMLMGVSYATVQRNTISDARGVHGNGLSAYLGNHDVKFIANTVINAKQPATFHGAGPEAPQDTDILFANNLFVAMPDSLGALISWGRNTRGVTIRNNVLLGGKAGMRLNGGDQRVVLTDNVASGLLLSSGVVPADWKVAGNAWTALSFQQRKLPAGEAAPSGVTKAAEELGKGVVGKPVCDVITRHSVTAPEFADGAKSIGASLACP